MATPSLSDRFRIGVDRISGAFWILMGLMALSLGFAIFTGHWTMWGLAGICFAIAVWAVYSKMWQWGGGKYQYKTLEMFFETDEVFRNKRDVKDFVENKWWPRWEDYAERHDLEMDELLEGVKVRVTPNKPITPTGKEVIGMTYPKARHTTIYSPGLFDVGAFGHELDLQAAHKVWGPQKEGEDIRLLKKHGIKG